MRDTRQGLWHAPTKTHSAPRRKWLMVADSGCAPPPMRCSTLALAPRAPAGIERNCNVLANVADVGNAPSVSPPEPVFDPVLDDLANRRQRLLFIAPMLSPIPLVLRAQGCRVGPRSLPVITVPASLLLPRLFGRSQRDARPPQMLDVVHLLKIAIASYIQVPLVKIAIEYIEDQSLAPPFHRIEIIANAGC